MGGRSEEGREKRERKEGGKKKGERRREREGIQVNKGGTSRVGGTHE